MCRAGARHPELLLPAHSGAGRCAGGHAQIQGHPWTWGPPHHGEQQQHSDALGVQSCLGSAHCS